MLDNFLELLEYFFTSIDYFSFPSYVSPWYYFALPFRVAIGAFILYEVIKFILKQVYK